MQISQTQESSRSGVTIDDILNARNQCSALIKIARTVGTAAGYFERSSTRDMIADAGMLLLRSPEQSVLAAAALGLLLGTVVRNRR